MMVNPAVVPATQQSSIYDIILKCITAFVVSTFLFNGNSNAPTHNSINGTIASSGIQRGKSLITKEDAKIQTHRKLESAKATNLQVQSLLNGIVDIPLTEYMPIFPTYNEDTNEYITHHRSILDQSKDAKINMQIYVSDDVHFSRKKASKQLVFELQDIAYDWSYTDVVSKNVSLSTKQYASFSNNQTLYAHVFMSLATLDMYAKYPLIIYRNVKHEVKRKKLLDQSTTGDNNSSSSDDALYNTQGNYSTRAFWKPTLELSLVLDFPSTYQINQLPVSIGKHINLTEYGQIYPVLYNNDFWLATKDYIEINSTSIHSNNHMFNLTVTYQHLSFFRWIMYTSMQSQWANNEKMGIDTNQGSDMIRGVLLDTHPLLLIVTVIVSMLHMLFDMLAFKNDVQFWRKKRSNAGLSICSLIINCFFQTIILLYLYDNDTSNMILFSSTVGLFIEYWKLSKAFNYVLQFSRVFPYIRCDSSYTQIKDSSAPTEVDTTKETQAYDAIATTHLLYLAIPLIVGYSIYSLVHNTHKSFYSWILNSLVGYVYAFGFILMTPQLYINYRLKSVAHMPWKAMIYKSLNTFIDDLFAFVIKMPLLHRLACFRDDLIFIVYLYQKWKYRVDYTRVNEYGQASDTEIKEIEDNSDHQ